MRFMHVLFNAEDTTKGADGEQVNRQVRLPDNQQPAIVGHLGTPSGFSCVSSTTVEGYMPAKGEIMTGDVGSVTFTLMHGSAKARVVRNQAKDGSAKLTLSFAPKYARGASESGIILDPKTSGEWETEVLNRWKAYRAERHYPVVVLVPKATLTASGVSD